MLSNFTTETRTDNSKALIFRKEQLNKQTPKKRSLLNTAEKLEHRDRKRRPFKRSSKKRDDHEDDDTFDNQGFADWLRSPDGSGLMKLFVITNTILVVATIAWPYLQRTYRMWRLENDPDYVY